MGAHVERGRRRHKKDSNASMALLAKAVESDPQFYPAVHQYARMLQVGHPHVT